MTSPFFTIDDARKRARRRMPRIIFDYIDGAAGDERTALRNRETLDNLLLSPRVLVNVHERTLHKSLLGRTWKLPFGIAPMGMCNLTWPHADTMLATAAKHYDMPVALSTMASSTIEDTHERAGDNAWFQIYVGSSEEIAYGMIDRAAACGYDTLIFTVDVPQVAPRPRDQRNGFKAPLKIGPKQFFDFATHPEWSIRSLLAGVPELANTQLYGEKAFVRDDSRGKVDWAFLNRLRQHWKGTLLVKGVLNPSDAIRIKDAGADGIYISNHGGRQLNSAPAAASQLPLIREAVGPGYPLLLDSGIRNGESIIKALALGADFVMLGRPFLYGIAAAGQQGMNNVVDLLAEQIDTAMAQLGITDVEDISPDILLENANRLRHTD